MYSAIRYAAVGYAVFFFYTYIPAYMFIVDESRPKPAIWLSLLWLAGAWITLISAKARVMLVSPLSVWCYAYIFLVTASAFLAPRAAFETTAYSDALIWAISVVVMQVVFSGTPEIQLFARKAILAGLILAMVACVIDFLQPGTFVPFDHPAANPGRAAGFYVNANSAGFALTLGALATLELLGTQMRRLLIIAVTATIALTFSRGAMVVWTVVVLFLLYRRTISGRDLLIAFLGLLGFGLAIAGMFSTVQLEQSSINNVLERIEWLSNPLDLQDDSGLERAEVLQLALSYFLQSPGFGHGLGATYLWEARGGTHNVYMELIVQFGLLGPLLIVWLFYGVAYKTTGTSRSMCLATIIAFLFWGLFSHNLLNDYSIPLMFALVSAMGQTDTFNSRTESARAKQFAFP